jgi:hypothetical protein
VNSDERTNVCKYCQKEYKYKKGLIYHIR